MEIEVVLVLILVLMGYGQVGLHNAQGIIEAFKSRCRRLPSPHFQQLQRDP